MFDFDVASDLMGRIKIPVKDLIRTPNEIFHRTDTLMGYEDADAMSGTLQSVFFSPVFNSLTEYSVPSWSIGFFTKVPLRKDLERLPEGYSPSPRRTAPGRQFRFFFPV